MSVSLQQFDFPPEPDADRLSNIRQLLQQSGRKIVVLDDDPTGTQTVYDTPVLTTWSTEALTQEFSRDGNLFFVLTNSRALPHDQATALAHEIGRNLTAASRQTGRPFSVISRSDSTLRGHYPAEVDALAEATSSRDAIQVVAPFFLQGGRYTIENVHYVADGDELVPASETPFARDATFGFQNSNLVDWVVEKRGGQFPRARVHSVSLTELRDPDLRPLVDRLVKVESGDVCVVNAIAMCDMHSFVLAAMQAEQQGQNFLYRTAASFVQSYAGLSPKSPLQSDQMINPDAQSGLIVVGSYVPKTTAQLSRLIENAPDISPIALDVDQLLGSAKETHIDQRINDINAELKAGRNVVLHTTRKLVTGPDAESSLDIGNQVSAAVVRVVRGVSEPLRFLIAKGGITSSDVATEGLEVRRAVVLGQILPGVPVWRLQSESRMPGLAYVVFPGNVGDDDGLLDAYQKLN